MKKTNDQQLPPHDEDAERAVLGAMLRDNHVIPDVMLVLRAEDFYADANQKVYRAITVLHDAGSPADLVTVAQELRRAGAMEDVGYPQLATFWDAAPTAANAEYYARIVENNSIRRGLIYVSTETLRDAQSPVGSVQDLLAEAEQRIFALSQFGSKDSSVDLQTAMQESYARYDARQQRGARNGLATGFQDLDEITCGLQDSEFVILASRTSIGKTSLAAGIALHVAQAGVPVLFISLEQSRSELADRLICSAGRIDSHRLRQGKLDAADHGRISEAGGLLRKCPLWIDDGPSQTISRISSLVRRNVLRRKVGLVVLDYLQLVDPENRRVSIREQVSEVSRRLKLLARETKVPMLVLSQLSRAAEEAERPRLHHLKESGSLEQDADQVWLLHRDEMAECIELEVAKNRNGRRGFVKLTFLPHYMRFEDYTGMPFARSQA